MVIIDGAWDQKDFVTGVVIVVMKVYDFIIMGIRVKYVLVSFVLQVKVLEWLEVVL